MSGRPGSPRARRGASIEDRLRLHMIEAPSGCWIWTGARNGILHGRIQLDGKTRYAHRVSYETFVGPIPDGLEIDHLCRRPNCINPRHLQPVTPQINVRRGTSPGARSSRRTHCLEGHSYADHGRLVRGRRICIVCRNERVRSYRNKDRGELPVLLRSRRREAGLSQVFVEAQLGLPVGYVCQVELGRRDVQSHIALDLLSLYMLHSAEQAA